MDLPKDYISMLEMIPEPAFVVSQGKIVCCNQQARSILPDTGAEIEPMLLNGKEEYLSLQEGCLSLQLMIGQTSWDATLTRLDEAFVFRIQQPEIPAEVKAMSLMGSQLRQSVSTLSLLANHSMADAPNADIFRQELSRIQRMLNNASNTEHYLMNLNRAQFDTDICAVLHELTEEAGVLLEQAGLHLEVSIPTKPVITLADEQGLRQAVYNLLSNAAKFSPAGGTIRCKAEVSGKLLRISITDEGEGIEPQQRIGIFSRFSRQATFEEGRKSLGLGLALVKAVAFAHGGTTLLDSPQGRGTRVTMTIALRNANTSILRRPVESLWVSSANEGLIMLSDVLPKEAYKQH